MTHQEPAQICRYVMKVVGLELTPNRIISTILILQTNTMPPPGIELEILHLASTRSTVRPNHQWLPCKPLCPKSKIEFFNPVNRSIHFIVNLPYQSLYEIKRAIQSCLFELVFTCETNNKARKVKIQFLHTLFIFCKLNVQKNDTVRKSVELCI